MGWVWEPLPEPYNGGGEQVVEHPESPSVSHSPPSAACEVSVVNAVLPVLFPEVGLPLFPSCVQRSL